MFFDRNIFQQLKNWKATSNPKPLLLRGARQVGKTSVLKYFGKKEYEHTAYFNFDREPNLSKFFEITKDPERIIRNLSLVAGFSIEAKTTLIIFDEIQECKDALNALKYFEESETAFNVVGAGSLLGVTLGNHASFPVGKIDFLDMYPLTFFEFLAQMDPDMGKYLSEIMNPEPIPDYFFNRIVESFRLYTISGGMPEPAREMAERRDLVRVEELLYNIGMAYELDFSKHVAPKDIQKISYIWQSIPSQLARENKKFLFQAVKQGARAREYEDALTWLIQSGLVYKVLRITKVGVPLSAYQDLSAFKIYFLDVGLLRKKAGLETRSILNPGNLFTEFKGALAENYVLQSLRSQFDIPPAYWASDGKAELDFLLQYQGELIPIEVKSEENVKGRSMSVYAAENNPKLKLRFSMKNLIKQDSLLNIPLFLSDRTRFFLDQELG